MSKLQLVLGNKNYSSWSLRAWLVARKSGLPFEEINLSLAQPGFDQSICNYSPTGRVPVLLVDGEPIWDSLAISEHLNEQSGHHLLPADSLVRAQARAICAEMHSGFEALRSSLPMNCRAERRKVTIDAATQRDIDRIMSIWGDVRERHGRNGEWLFGEFSIADAFFAPVVFRFRTYGVSLDAIAHSYMDYVATDSDVQQWLVDARRETEILPEEEVGE